MPTDHVITRQAQCMLMAAKIMMDHSDDGCIMMMFVEEILLAELQNEYVQTNIDEPSDQALEIYLASVMRHILASTRSRGFPTLLYADTELSWLSGSSSEHHSLTIPKSEDADENVPHELVCTPISTVLHMSRCIY